MNVCKKAKNYGIMGKKKQGVRMLDRLTQSVLDYVNAQTDGSYKVLEAADFLAAVPARVHTDEAGVENALRYLSERGYIDIRYSDRGTYCVCSLPKGRTYAERAAVDETKGRQASRRSFLYGFFGGLAGGLIGALAAGLILAFFL